MVLALVVARSLTFQSAISCVLFPQAAAGAAEHVAVPALTQWITRLVTLRARMCDASSDVVDAGSIECRTSAVVTVDCAISAARAAAAAAGPVGDGGGPDAAAAAAAAATRALAAAAQHVNTAASLASAVAAAAGGPGALARVGFAALVWEPSARRAVAIALAADGAPPSLALAMTLAGTTPRSGLLCRRFEFRLAPCDDACAGPTAAFDVVFEHWRAGFEAALQLSRAAALAAADAEAALKSFARSFAAACVPASASIAEGGGPSEPAAALLSLLIARPRSCVQRLGKTVRASFSVFMFAHARLCRLCVPPRAYLALQICILSRLARFGHARKRAW